MLQNNFLNIQAFILHKVQSKFNAFVLKCLTSQGLIEVFYYGSGTKIQALNSRVIVNLILEKKKDVFVVKSLDAELVSDNFLPLEFFSILYVNELMLNLVPINDDCNVFANYSFFLNNLNKLKLELNLRIFELNLLKSLGYEFNLSIDGNGNLINPYKYYKWSENSGLQVVYGSGKIYLGRQLLDFLDGIYNKQTLSTIKRLMREVLSCYLGCKTVKTRELIMEYLKYE